METITTSRTMEKRGEINQVLNGESQSLLLVQGPCAPDIDGISQLMDEAHDLNHVTRSMIPGLVAVNRLPIWKPRSDPASWSGIHSSHPEAADALINEIDDQYGMAGIEIGLSSHVINFASRIAFGWTGARNVHNRRLMQKLAAAEPTLPLSAKNGMDGRIDEALDAIEIMKAERDTNGGAVVLIFRGGSELQTPEAWEKAYLEALDATNGRMIVDVAHGGEMAHSPEGDFTKSAIGQIACFDHVIALANDGHIPVGVMTEASDTVSQVDPVIPFETSILKAIELMRAVREQRITQGEI